MTAMIMKAAFFVDWSIGTDTHPTLPRVQVLDHVSFSPFFNLTYDSDVAIGKTEWGRTYNTDSINFMGCPDHHGPCPLQQDYDAMFSKNVNFGRLNKTPHRYSSDKVQAMILAFGLTPFTAGGCLLHTLIHPTPSIVEEARPLALKILDPHRPHVSVHVRTDDKVMHDQMNRTSEMGYMGDIYWKCAATVIAEVTAEFKSLGLTVKPRIFFSTDHYAYKKEAVATMGEDAVLIYDVKPWHASRQALWWDGHSEWRGCVGGCSSNSVRSPPTHAHPPTHPPSVHRKTVGMPDTIGRLRITFIEWWLMSLCEYFVMGGLSGYSRSAMSYSEATRGHTVLNYEGRRWEERGCTNKNPVRRDEIYILGGGR